jgi:peptidoglycan/LPS O-acetylase OafA/YrhL
MVSCLASARFAADGRKPYPRARDQSFMDKPTNHESRKTLAAGAGIVAVVTAVLATNSTPSAPTLDMAAVWSGTLGLLLLVLNSIHGRLKVLESRLYALAREVSELRGRTRKRS